MKKTVLMLVLSWMVSMAVAQPATMSKEGDELIKFVSVIKSYNLEKHPQEVEIPFSEFITPYKIETKGKSIMFSFQSDIIGVALENHAVKLIKNGWFYKPQDQEQINRLLESLWWYQEFIKKPTTTKIFYDEKFN